MQLLPPLTLNSDSLSIVAAAPMVQPVVHLGGRASQIEIVDHQVLIRYTVNRDEYGECGGMCWTLIVYILIICIGGR